MPFYPPSWVPKLPEVPDSIPVCDFMLEDHFDRYPLGYARPMFVCGLSGKSIEALEVKERVDFLARGLAKELGFQPNERTEWDKVVGVFSLNTIDTIPLAWAIHRLGGVSTPANAAFNAPELYYQLENSGAKCVFTCTPLLKTTLEAAEKAGIPKNRIYIMELPKEATGGLEAPEEFKTVEQLIQEGKKEPKLERLNWPKGEGARRTAFLCYSSGTSGVPKGVMISHRNIIANTMQIATTEKPTRDSQKEPGTDEYLENTLGLLPLSHIYGLVVVAHASAYRGDSCIILPKFEMKTFLTAIQKYKINGLYIVPPIIIQMVKNPKILSQYDLSSVRYIYTGAAPTGKETIDDLRSQYPSWIVKQAYGLTETSTLVSVTIPSDVWVGSSGSFISGIECKVTNPEGNEITEYDTPGELWVKGPAVTLGYLKNEKATEETFINGYMRTGDEVEIRKGPNGYEHVFIVDRIKELIKVKGHQVAPAELESHLLSHPAVNDCTVIPVHDDDSGEVPKAYVVKSPEVGLEESDVMLKRSIMRHVEKHKARYKWLKGGVEFIDVIPKSPSGKILRRLLRDKEREKRRQQGAKL